MDEFDVGDCCVALVGHLLLELLDSFGDVEIDLDLQGLLFRGGFEVKLDHLKNY